MVRQIVWGVGLADILLDATGWVAEEKALDPLGRGGFVYGRISKTLFVQPDAGRSPAENGLNNFLAGLDRPADLLCQQAHLFQQAEHAIIQRFFPAAQRLQAFTGKQHKIGQFEIDLLERPKAG